MVVSTARMVMPSTTTTIPSENPATIPPLQTATAAIIPPDSASA